MGKSEPIRDELKEQGYSLPSTHGPGSDQGKTTGK